MDETKPPADSTDLPEDLQEEVKNTIRDSFKLFADYSTQMTEDLKEFNANRQAVREKIRSGSNRTTGRIV